MDVLDKGAKSKYYDWFYEMPEPIRLDVANEVNHDFWRRFRKAVRESKKDTFFIGEICDDEQE